MKVEESELRITFDDLLVSLPKDKRKQIASSDAIILPINFHNPEKIGEQPFRDRTIEINKLLRNKGIKSELFEGETQRPILELRGIDFIMPTIAFLTTDPNVRTIVINIISQIIYDGLKFLTKRAEKQTPVLFEFIEISKNGSLKSIKFQGSAEEFEEISKALRNF